MRWQTTVPVLALILMLGAVGAWLTRDLWGPAPEGAAERPVLGMPEGPAIAVLPFVNLSGDPAGDRLADALTENVITNLSLSRDLFVIARNSTLTYKDRSVDPRQIGRELGVMYILEGSIQASSDRVRITAQLIEAATGRHVSSNRYDRPLEDIFAIQDEVTEKVAGMTGWEGAIAEAGRAVARRKPPANLQAYDYYLLGIEAKHKETKEDNIRAQELFRKALELDPRFARAGRTAAIAAITAGSASRSSWRGTKCGSVSPSGASSERRAFASAKNSAVRRRSVRGALPVMALSSNSLQSDISAIFLCWLNGT